MDRAEAYRREVEMLFRTWKEKNPLDGMDHQHGIFIRGRRCLSRAVVFPNGTTPVFY